MTPDGKVLAYCNETNEVVLWDLEVNQKICTLLGNTSPIKSIYLSSDREWVVSYETNQTIKIYGLLDE
jgi:WD40 repeat protein